MSDGIFDWDAIEWEEDPFRLPLVVEVAVGLNDLERWLASPDGQRAARVAAFDREAA